MQPWRSHDGLGGNEHELPLHVKLKLAAWLHSGYLPCQDTYTYGYKNQATPLGAHQTHTRTCKFHMSSTCRHYPNFTAFTQHLAP